MVSAHRFVDPHADAKGTWPHSALRHPTVLRCSRLQGTSKGGHPAGAAREPQAADQALAFFQTLVGYMLCMLCMLWKAKFKYHGNIHWKSWKYTYITYSKCLLMNWEKGNHRFYPLIH